MSIPSCLDKLIRYLGKHPSGVASGQLAAWIASCQKEGGYSGQDFDEARRALRDSGRGVCTNGRWWLKDISTVMKEAAYERKTIVKARRESERRKKLGTG